MDMFVDFFYFSREAGEGMTVYSCYNINKQELTWLHDNRCT